MTEYSKKIEQILNEAKRLYENSIPITFMITPKIPDSNKELQIHRIGLAVGIFLHQLMDYGLLPPSDKIELNPSNLSYITQIPTERILELLRDNYPLMYRQDNRNTYLTVKNDKIKVISGTQSYLNLKFRKKIKDVKFTLEKNKYGRQTFKRKVETKN